MTWSLRRNLVNANEEKQYSLVKTITGIYFLILYLIHPGFIFVHALLIWPP